MAGAAGAWFRAFRRGTPCPRFEESIWLRVYRIGPLPPSTPLHKNIGTVATRTPPIQ